MCGICGLVELRHGRGVDPATGRRVSEAMQARGPDGSGEWLDPADNAWLGHRRLAIIDLSPTGAQPMQAANSEVAIAFNGEIYNHPALRAELIAKGHVFRGTSDTETILRLYLEEGEACVERLRGMFAFAIWDRRSRTLFAARDPLGIKPFYYAEAEGVFRFASSVKALLRDEAIPREPDAAGLVGFGLLGSVPEPFTSFAAIRALPAGHRLTVGPDRAVVIVRYDDFTQLYRAAEANAGQAFSPADAEAVSALLRDSVSRHMLADVPVGAFLSAGIDSGALVGMMAEAGRDDIRTVTLAYDELRGAAADEAPLARIVADHYGAEHERIGIGREDFLGDIDAIMAAMDQPSIDGVNSWFVSKAARAAGLKVAVSGVGGDELFGGYDSFSSVPRFHGLAQRLKPLSGIAPLAPRIVSMLGRLGLPIHPKSSGLLGLARSFEGAYLLQRAVFLPHELPELLSDEAALQRGFEQLALESRMGATIAGLERDFTRVAALETAWYMRNQLLRDTDWASMAHSLEIRTPLVDRILLEGVAPYLLKTGRPSGKQLLARAPRRPLPDEVIHRPKTGFSIPVRRWLDPDSTASANADRLFSRNWAKRVLDRRAADGPLVEPVQAKAA